MSVWKQLLIICVLGALGYGGFEAYKIYYPADAAASKERPSRPAPVEIALAENRVLAMTVEAVGTTRARQSVMIVPEDDGRIVDMSIEPGAFVEKGTVLVRLDDAIQRADLAEAEARVVERRQALERVTQLRDSNAVSQATLEDTTARLAEARAQLDRAEQRFADRVIKAPFDGVVGLAEIDPGARLSEGDVITRLDDLREVIVEFSLPETLFATVAIGQVVEAKSAAFPGRTFAGRVEALDSRIDPTSRAFRARAVLPNPDSILPSGMFMSLTLILSEREAPVVPEEAIVFQAAETYVFTVEGDIAERRAVSTGQRRDGYIEIIEGAEPGLPVVVRGLQRVRDNGPITILNPELLADPSASEGDT